LKTSLGGQHFAISLGTRPDIGLVVVRRGMGVEIYKRGRG